MIHGRGVRGRCVAFLALVLIALNLICSSYALADSERDFKERCAPCHGTRGAGDTKLGQHLKVRDLGSPEVQKESDAELAGITAKGKGRMPAYERKLTKEQIEGLVKFMRSLKK